MAYPIANRLSITVGVDSQTAVKKIIRYSSMSNFWAFLRIFSDL